MANDTVLTADDKAALASKLNDAADLLDDQISNAQSDADADALDERATELRNQAADLVAQAIVLRQGDTELDASMIGNAVSHCKQVMDSVADVKKKIQVATALLTFLPSLMTGDVPTIIKAGVALNNSLSDIEKSAG